MNLLARVRAYGFTDDELERAVEGLDAELQQRLDTLDTRQDRQWADLYVAGFLGGADLSSTTAQVARVRALVDELTVDDVGGHLAWVLDNSAPLVVTVAPDSADLPTVAALTDVVTRPDAGTDPALDEAVEEIDELMARPDAVEEAERIDHAALFRDQPVTELQFDNGVRLIVTSSEIDAGNVDLFAVASGGWRGLEPGAGALVDVATRAVADSGIAGIDKVALDRFRAGTTLSLSPYVADHTEGFRGTAAVDDVELLFQLLHLMVTEPQVDAPALRRAVRAADERRLLVESDPQSAAFDEIVKLAVDDDPAFRTVPTADELAALTTDDTLALYRSRFGQLDDLVVAVTGDIAPTRLLDLGRRYLGTLPTAEPGEPGTSDPAVDGPLRRQIAVGTGDASGVVLMMFGADIEPTPTTQVQLDLLQAVLQFQLFDSVREDLGASYGGSVFADLGSEPDDSARMSLLVNADPGRLDEIERTLLDATEELADNGPNARDFAQAVATTFQDYDFVNNGQLLDMMVDIVRFPDELLRIPDRFAVLDRTDEADLRRLAADLFDESGRVTVVARPVG